jgi:hypothetical protein
VVFVELLHFINTALLCGVTCNERVVRSNNKKLKEFANKAIPSQNLKHNDNSPEARSQPQVCRNPSLGIVDVKMVP